MATLLKVLAIVIGLIVLAGVAFILLSRPSAAERQKAAETSAMMRRAVLSREILQTMPPAGSGKIRAVVYDWRLGSATATLITYEDGTTSLYFSSGGGIIGAGAHEPVVRAAALMREEAAKVVGRFSPASDFPLPGDDQSAFYIVMDSVTLGSGALSSSDLSAAGHVLHNLKQRAQEVITQMRKAS